MGPNIVMGAFSMPVDVVGATQVILCTSVKQVIHVSFGTVLFRMNIITDFPVFSTTCACLFYIKRVKVFHLIF